jgi:DNA-binding response OmpR family regulator
MAEIQQSEETPARTPEQIGLRDNLLDTFKGKRFALLGFNTAEADHIRATAESVGLRVHAIVREAGYPGLNSLAPFDGCVVNLSAGSIDGAPGDVLAISRRPAIIIGERAEIMRHALALGAAKNDFIIRPWEDEEFLLRAFRVLRVAEIEGEEPGRAPAREQPTIVVADDDRTTVMLVQSMLRTWKMNCAVADNGRDALSLTRKLKPDALLLDISMPEMDGFEVLAALRSDPATREIPVVMLTAAQGENDIVRGFTLGADDYITKPFHPHEMLARLKRLVRIREE